MTDEDVIRACYDRLETMAGAPAIKWPNQGGAVELPRIEMQGFANEPQTVSLGGTHRRRYLLQATVVVAEHEREWTARGIAENVIARFGWNVAIATGLRVYRRPYSSPGFNDGPEWRLPVTIPVEVIE